MKRSFELTQQDIINAIVMHVAKETGMTDSRGMEVNIIIDANGAYIDKPDGFTIKATVKER